MANIKEIIYAEMENITKVLIELEKVKDRPNKELVVLVGIGAYLQNIYTGMENVLKQLLSYKGILIPDTSTWHKDLLNLAVEHDFITKETADKIGRYLFFCHFFSHAYGFLLDEMKLNPLMNSVSGLYFKFKEEIDNSLIRIEQHERH
jgi:hypothetical protein